MSPARLIDGAEHAAKLRSRTLQCAWSFFQARGRRPRLDVIIVGDHPASRSYVATKTKQAAETGIDGRLVKLPESIDQGTLREEIRKLNATADVDRILVQLPLPLHLDPAVILDEIDPTKDVHGNVGRLSTAIKIDPKRILIPCTPLGTLLMLRSTLGPQGMSGKHTVVVGSSNIVGKPMAQLLVASDCTVTVAHSRSFNLTALCRSADILMAAIGRPEMIRGSWIKPGATVIDVGINRIPAEGGKGRIVGDVATEEAKEFANFITPVPGGVGRMTVACLLHNTVTAAERRLGITTISTA
jgi:methylenetetrahydrofolate dehydrogenase (NADP+)/methenyltetrahydrofolate cyclohydrolase